MDEKPLEINAPNWSRGQKLLFRFLSAYLFWYIFPFPLMGQFPVLSEIAQYYQELLNNVGVWVGNNLLGIEEEISTKANGSGDKTINYAINFFILLMSLITGVIWTILDRNRANYNTLLYWVQVLVRYYLAVVLMGYGFAKIYKTQFPFPSLNRLIQPFGDASPMGLAWTFMGYSTTFNYFTGFGEAIAGFLLFFRRTQLLGAFIGISVMSTVFMMNMSFDIPVKLFSGNLLFMLFCLLIPEMPRLLNFFWYNKNVLPANRPSAIKGASLKKIALVGKYAYIALMLFFNISGGIENEKKWGDKRTKPPLYGIYMAKQVIINQDTIPPLITDGNRWHTLTVDRPDRGTIHMMDGQIFRCDFKTDTIAHTIGLKIYSTMHEPVDFEYKELPNNYLELDGVMNNGADTVHVLLEKKDLNSFLLVKRGFNWINESPFNR